MNSRQILSAFSPMPSKIYVSKQEQDPTRLRVNLPYDPDWVLKIKSVKGRRYHNSKKCWTVPYTEEVVKDLERLFSNTLVFEWEKSNIKQGELASNFPTAKGIKSAASSDLSQFNRGRDESDFFLHPRQIDHTKSGFRQANKKNPHISNRDKNIDYYISPFVEIQKESDFRLKVFVSVDKKGWIEIVKSIPGRTWNEKKRYWTVPYVKESLALLQQVGESFLRFTFSVSNDIPLEIKKAPRKEPRQKRVDLLNEAQKNGLMALEEQLMLERKSWRTLKSYKLHLVNLFLKYPKTKPSQITVEQIRKFIFYRVNSNKISESTQSQMINALNAFYKRVLNQEEKMVEVPRPKKAKKLPNVFSQREVETLIKTVPNLKHKTMICLAYSAGLRKGEVLNLRVRDVLYERNCIFVKDAKGRKDRFVMLSPKAAKMIRAYKKIYAPKYWLFEGSKAGKYSESSFQSIFNRAKEKAGVTPSVTIHGLRHSYATHLIEKGVPLHVIKEMLGHSSIKTTEVYMHVSNAFLSRIKSPLEDLDIG